MFNRYEDKFISERKELQQSLATPKIKCRNLKIVWKRYWNLASNSLPMEFQLLRRKIKTVKSTIP